MRELENAIERAVLVAKTPDVQPQDLPEAIRGDSAAEVEGWVPRSYENRTGLELMLWWRRKA